MKTLIVKLSFDDETKGAVSSVSEALKDFEISHISWEEKPVAPAWNHRAATTARSALEGI